LTVFPSQPDQHTVNSKAQHVLIVVYIYIYIYMGIEVTGRQGRRCRMLLDDLKERRGYCHLKEKALDRTMWRAGFGRGFGPVVRQTSKGNIYIYIYIYIRG